MTEAAQGTCEFGEEKGGVWFVSACRRSGMGLDRVRDGGRGWSPGARGGGGVWEAAKPTGRGGRGEQQVGPGTRWTRGGWVHLRGCG